MKGAVKQFAQTLVSFVHTTFLDGPCTFAQWKIKQNITIELKLQMQSFVGFIVANKHSLFRIVNYCCSRFHFTIVLI